MSERKNILFLSSSFVNIAKIFAENNPNYDVFLVIDRKFPFEIEDLDNFYPFTFNQDKVFERNREKYFDNLAVFTNEFEPDLIITNNFSKLLPASFIDFAKFRNSKMSIINIHHGDLTVNDTDGGMAYAGLNSDIKEFLSDEEIVTTFHLIEDAQMDTGEQLGFSHPTTLKELKQKSLVHKKEDILNLRLRNVILSYHERTKCLNLLKKLTQELTK